MKLRMLTVLAVACLLAPAAHAGGFLGASAGQSAVNTDSDFKDNDIGWKMYGGYNFIKYFGLEGDYANLGTWSEETPGAEFSTDVQGLGLYARGIIPLGQKVELFGKVGLVYWQADVSVSGQQNISGSETGNDLAYGAGAAFKLAEKFSLRLEYERFDIESSGNTSLGSVGFSYRF